MYVFSVEDCASVFNGNGEGGALEKLEKHPKFHIAFRQLGEEWNLKYRVLKQLEEFTSPMYGQNRESSMDGLRAKLLRAKLLRTIVVEDEKLTLETLFVQLCAILAEITRKIDLSTMAALICILNCHRHI